MKNLKNILKISQLAILVAMATVFFVGNICAKQLQRASKDIKFQQPLLVETTKEPQITQLSKEELAKKKGLLIFLDASEGDYFGAVSHTLLMALDQEASPIITSNSLLHAIFKQRIKDSRANDIIYDVIKSKKEYGKDNILISKIAFKPDRWIIKKVNNYLSLLIPLSYLESLDIDQEKVKEYDSSSSAISDIELKIGFKVNHMETLDYALMSRSVGDSISRFFTFVRYFVNGNAYYFIEALELIFCKKIDYKSKKIVFPEWYIYIDGHGLINDSVAGLSFYDFKRLLQFLDHKIITKLLMVSSCYAAGVNAHTIYGDIKLKTQQYYSFPIIIQGLNDVVVFGNSPKIYEHSYDGQKTIKLSHDIDFVNFFKKAKELEGNYDKIVEPLYHDKIENTAQIKLPGIEWFSVIDADQKIVSIGSILAKARDPEKPLDILSFFKKDPEIILLYAEDIPFELKVNSHHLKAIVPMVALSLQKEDAIRTAYETSSIISRMMNNWLNKKLKIMDFMISSRLIPKDIVQSICRIKKISSTTYIFDHMLDWFKSIQSARGYKWLLIDEMIDSKGILHKDILVVYGRYPWGITAYFKDKDNVLCKSVLSPGDIIRTEKVESDSVDEKYYNERVHIIQNEYPILAQKAKEAKQEITPEQIKKIEDVLRRKIEAQKALK